MKIPAFLLALGVAVASATAQDAPAVPAPGFTLAFEEARAALIHRANGALTAGPFTVMDKTSVPPSGDKHDFYTLSPYHWPAEDKPHGPYIFRDGQVNPEAETEAYDRVRFFAFSDAVCDLARAYRWTGDRRFAERAAYLMRTWFFDEATRMNPNLAYAQHVPGNDNGPPWGIIRGIRFLDLMEAVKQLHASGEWTTEDDAQWKAWLGAYLDWLQTSDKGKREAKAPNNHGTWYDVQVATIAVLLGQEELARTVIEQAKEARIARHIDPDGQQPLEQRRTKSWDYAIMNLEGLVRLAELGGIVDVDLWNYTTADGRGLKKALTYILPFAAGRESWPNESITEFEPAACAPLLWRAGTAYEEPAWHEWALGLRDSLSALAEDALIAPDAYETQ